MNDQDKVISFQYTEKAEEAITPLPLGTFSCQFDPNRLWDHSHNPESNVDIWIIFAVSPTDRGS